MENFIIRIRTTKATYQTRDITRSEGRVGYKAHYAIVMVAIEHSQALFEGVLLQTLGREEGFPTRLHQLSQTVDSTTVLFLFTKKKKKTALFLLQPSLSLPSQSIEPSYKREVKEF